MQKAAGRYPALPTPYLIVEGPWLLPQVFGGPKVLQALGLAQWLQGGLQVQAVEDIFQEVNAGSPVRWSWDRDPGLPCQLFWTLCLISCTV